jgi:hypothetical protein
MGIKPAYLLRQLQKVASLMPAFRQISGTGGHSSACRSMKAIYASVDVDFRMPKIPSAARAAKLEFSSFERSRKPEAGHTQSQILRAGKGYARLTRGAGPWPPSAG